MERIVNIGDKEIKLRITAATLIHYRNEFNQDPLKSIMKLSKIEEDTTELDLEVFYNLFYIMAKSCDKTIIDKIEFYERFDFFPFEELLPVIMEFISKSFGSIKKN